MRCNGNNLRAIWPYLLLCLLPCLAYLPTLFGDFILDDHPLVKDNSFIREPQGIGAYFAQEDGVTHVYKGEKIHTGYYRPLINMTYRLDYWLWGLHAPGFRLTNLVLHLLTSLVLFSLLFHFSKNRVAAFLGAAFFALHPVNSEAVSWISSRNNLLAALWGLSAFGFHVLAWERKRSWAFAVSTLCFGIAVFSKEFGLMVLPLLFLYHRVPAERGRDFRLEAASYVPLALVLLLYLWLRSAAIGGFLTTGAETAGLPLRLYYTPYLLLLNLGLVVFPFGLHSFIVGYPAGFFTWQALAGFAFLGLCVFALWKSRGRSMLFFGIGGFLLTLLPVLNILPTSSVTVISMRWLYFPMVFLVFALTEVLRQLLDRKRQLFTALCVAVGVYLGAYTWMLNAHFWHDEEGFFRQEVLRFDNLHYVGGLAEKLQEAGKIQEAEGYFRIAVDKYPGAAMNFINYAALMIDTGRPGEAVALLSRAEPLAMTVREGAQWANNMGMALFAQGRVEQALKHLKEAVAACPMEPLFWSNLGAAYGSTGDLDASEAAFRSGLERTPDSDLLRRNLAVTYEKRGEHQRARDLLRGMPQGGSEKRGVSK